MLVATAGHVDHGKTVLVRALTGVDTDRLPEEKRRGLTIDLGFAYVALGDGRTLGFVDVPGHERFVRNMIAGVPAIDFGLLVVAADDGPMPQTREHLAILDLLGVRRGAAAITKVDRVAEARVAEVTGEVESLLAATSLAGAPIFPVCALEGTGVEDIDAHLRTCAGTLPPPRPGGVFRLAVDRSFTVAGAGLVVTGAVYSGEARPGDRLNVLPGERAVRVRSIESAGADAECARAGERCALNLAGRGSGPAGIARGDWIVGEEAGPVTDRFDARVRVLGSEERALRRQVPVHVHLGASFVTGRATPIEVAAIEPGANGLVRVALDRPGTAVHGDRFCLRDASGRRTIGGGTVVDPYPPRRARDRALRLRVLGAMEHEDPGEALAASLEASPAGIEIEPFLRGRNLDADAARAVRRGADPVEVDTSRGRLAFAARHWEALRGRVMAEVERDHTARPDASGPSVTALRRSLARDVPARVVDALVARLVREGDLARDGPGVRFPRHRPLLTRQDAALWEAIAPHLEATGTKPPAVSDLATRTGQKREALLDFLERCARRGRLVRVAANRFFLPQAIARLARGAESLARERDDGFDAAAFRDATGIGRNLTIDVLEHFDATGFTRRIGDRRRIARPAGEIFGPATADEDTRSSDR